MTVMGRADEARGKYVAEQEELGRRWGLTKEQFYSGMRVLAVIVALGAVWMSTVYHRDFFGEWAHAPLFGWILGGLVSVGQFVLWNEGWRNRVLLVGGVFCFIYDAIAVSEGLLKAVGATPTTFDIVLVCFVGTGVSIFAEALIYYGLVKDWR